MYPTLHCLLHSSTHATGHADYSKLINPQDYFCADLFIEAVTVAELISRLRLPPGRANLAILAGISKLCAILSLSTSNTYARVVASCIEVEHALPVFSGTMVWLMNSWFSVLDVWASRKAGIIPATERIVDGCCACFCMVLLASWGWLALF